MKISDEMVRSVAEAIAKNGVGRPWDDFLPVNVHDMDHGDLEEYARAAIEAIAPLMAKATIERCAQVAGGSYPNESNYHEDSPYYGSDLNPDRSEYGRGKQAGRSDAAKSIRNLAKET